MPASGDAAELPYFSFVEQIRPGAVVVLDRMAVGCVVEGWTISIGSGLGAALGSWAGGLIHDFTGNYDVLLVFSLVSVVLGMIPFLVVPALRQ